MSTSSAADALCKLLRSPGTGRAVISALFQYVIEEGHGSAEASSLFVDPTWTKGEDDRSAREARGVVERCIADTFQRSVEDGELPEGAEVPVLGALCMSALAGFSFRALDGQPVADLLRASQHLVEAIGFHPAARRTPRQRGRGGRM